MELIKQYEQLHREGQFRAWAARPFIDKLAAAIRETGSHRLLDYGCGGATLESYREAMDTTGLGFSFYEPAIPALSKKPVAAFDGVIATDVLEHIPEHELPGVFAALAYFGTRFIFATVCCRPAKKTLPDGRNCHVTIKPLVWWARALRQHSDCRIELFETP